MTDLDTWLTDQVVAADLTIGAAITVLHRGEPIFELDLGVDARGTRVERSSLFCVRCALVKPALGLGLAALIDQGAVDPAGTIGDHLQVDELADAVGAVPMRALMEHTAGLHYTGEIAMTVVAPAARRTIAVATPPRPHDPAVEPIVAGAVGGVLVAMIIESVTGEPFTQFIERAVFRPIGLCGNAWLVAEGAEADAVLDRLLLGLGIDGRRRRPLLLERTRWTLGDWNPGYGGVATSSALAALYDSVLAHVVGRPSALPLRSATVRELLTRHEPGDPRWWLPVGFGFVRNSRDDISLRYLPPGGFGFSGNRMAFASASPQDDLVVAACFIGRHSTDPTLAEMREQRVMELALELVR